MIECKNLSYSTGPSGVYLEKLFSGWGLAELLKSKTVVPPPGTPVASLLARGDVELGFQQMSELLSVGGIEVVGVLPPEIEFITRFSAGIPVGLKDNRQKLLAVKNWLDFLVSSQAESVKRRHGMNWIVN